MKINFFISEISKIFTCIILFLNAEKNLFEETKRQKIGYWNTSVCMCLNSKIFNDADDVKFHLIRFTYIYALFYRLFLSDYSFRAKLYHPLFQNCLQFLDSSNPELSLLDDPSYLVETISRPNVSTDPSIVSHEYLMFHTFLSFREK